MKHMGLQTWIRPIIAPIGRLNTESACIVTFPVVLCRIRIPATAGLVVPFPHGALVGCGAFPLGPTHSIREVLAIVQVSWPA